MKYLENYIVLNLVLNRYLSKLKSVWQLHVSFFVQAGARAVLDLSSLSWPSGSILLDFIVLQDKHSRHIDLFWRHAALTSRRCSTTHRSMPPYTISSLSSWTAPERMICRFCSISCTAGKHTCIKTESTAFYERPRCYRSRVYRRDRAISNSIKMSITTITMNVSANEIGQAAHGPGPQRCQVRKRCHRQD